MRALGSPRRGLLASLGVLVVLSQAPPPCAALDLKVMSFNLRYATADDGEDAWEHRQELLLETIRSSDPDLLGTQECLAGQAEFLRAALPAYGFVGVGRDDGALAGEMSALFYRRAAFRLLDEGHIWLSETPETPGSRGWDAALPRIASWALLRSEVDTTLTLWFCNTHFDHVGEVARSRSAELLRERAHALVREFGEAPQNHRSAVQVILTGDFNSPADIDAGGPYRVLISGKRVPQGAPDRSGAATGGATTGSTATADPWIDTYRALHAPAPGEGTYHAFRGTRDGARIDWVLVSPSFEVTEARIVRLDRNGRYPSDHFPVTARLRWTAPWGGSGTRRED